MARFAGSSLGSSARPRSRSVLGRSLLVGAIASAVVAGSAAGAMAAPKSAAQGGTAVTAGSSATGVADAGPVRGRAWS